jgi:hypothetical protein
MPAVDAETRTGGCATSEMTMCWAKAQSAGGRGMDSRDGNDQRTDDARAPRRPEHDLVERDSEARRQDVAADARDEKADASDRDADLRDHAAEQRDITADKREMSGQVRLSTVLSPPDGNRARTDRESSAVDRAESAEDRDRARIDRQTSGNERERASQDRGAAWDAMIQLRELLAEAESDAEDMRIINEAQDVMMRMTNAGPNAALADLCLRAARKQSSLAEASRDILADFGPPLTPAS